MAMKNHGIPEPATEGALQMTKKFFDLPIEKKMEARRDLQLRDLNKSSLIPDIIPTDRIPNPYGAGDMPEGFEFGREEHNPTGDNEEAGAVMAGANVWPAEEDIPGFREQILQYYYAAVSLGKSLFPIFALALDLPETFFDDKTQHSAALMKLLHYPPQTGPVDERVIGLGAHTDWECFTILWQEPGIQVLQVLNSEKKWIDAPPIPGTFVINLGDQFARWTNDIFKSTVHRAINRSGVRRCSIPLFFGTDYNVKLEPMPSCISPERPPKYEVITAGEYVKSRLEAAYNH
ncbi:hypothetical protein D9613_005736 [Agrocybe pediades]|uniref:Fe2OG dioxygenase domain-containing protein n=1 Tax=Agrocybe pediades TaxID=84607 RepID=A0A8H4QW98_9AGAR|nr:hypothetical protein D9613_005736 [Agrocybe pediades]